MDTVRSRPGVLEMTGVNDNRSLTILSEIALDLDQALLPAVAEQISNFAEGINAKDTAKIQIGDQFAV